MENNNFKDFTNLYEIPKTLRFELKPTDEKSKKAIEIKNFETDFLIKNNRKKLFFLYWWIITRIYSDYF